MSDYQNILFAEAIGIEQECEVLSKKLPPQGQGIKTNKMSALGTPLYDYSHLLPKERIAEGYNLYTTHVPASKDKSAMVVSYLHHKGQPDKGHVSSNMYPSAPDTL